MDQIPGGPAAPEPTRSPAIPRRKGFTLIVASIAIVISALIFSEICSARRTAAGGDGALRVRVDLQLEAVRVLREVAELLRNSTSVDVGPSQEFAFRRPRNIDGADERDNGTFAIVLVPGSNGDELQLRRHDASGAVVSTRLLARGVERIQIEPVPPQQPPGATQFRVTAWFRRVVDTKIYSVRETCAVTMQERGN